MSIDKKKECCLNFSFANMKRFLLLALLILCKANDDDDVSQITLMTYNVMLVPSLLVLQRDQITRAHLLTKAKFLRSSDILCLQEVFQPKPTKILLDSLSETYPYSTPILGNEDDIDNWNETWNRKIGRSSFKFVSGGLTILSKWPIIFAAQYFYRHSCSGHTFVRSGFIYTRILYGKNEIPIHIIGTHLQPSDHRGCYLSSEDETRDKQMNEITGFIDESNISKSELLFFLGDFNIDKYNIEQYEAMIDILRVKEQYLYPSSIPCTWDSSFNAMSSSKHQENQLLDYIFIHKDHTLNNSLWYNLIVDRMASEQWHLLGRNRMFYNTRNIPLIELSDHYPVIGFFNLTKQQWPERPSGVLTYVQFVTADTNLPVMINDRNIQIGNSSNSTGSLFILTNNGTPRRHRCLRSEQYIILIDGYKPEFYLSDAKYFRMKYGMEQVNRYLKIIQIDNATKCIETNSTFILQARLSTGFFYVNNTSSQLCSCTNDRNQAQQFRLIEVKRKNISCTITH
jgi:phospholipase C